MADTDHRRGRRNRRGGNRGEGITLSDIIRGLQYCVNSSQEIVELHHIRAFDRFLDESDKPLVRTIKFNDSAAIDVPLLCMSGHSSLALDELNVKLDLMLRNTALKGMTDEANPNLDDQTQASNRNGKGLESGISRTSFGVDLVNVRDPSRKYAHLEIGMKFKSSDPPELLSRVIDRLNNATDVYTVKENAKESSKIIDGGNGQG